MAIKNVIEGSNKVSAAQLKDFFRQIEERGITGDHIQAILERRNPFNEDLKIELISKKDKLYEVEVDGLKTIKQLIEDGEFRVRKNKFREEDLIILNRTKRKINVKLFDFPKSTGLRIKDVTDAMLKENFQPLRIEELLSLGIQYPQLQSQFNIAAMGTSSLVDKTERPFNYRLEKSTVSGPEIYHYYYFYLVQGNKEIFSFNGRDGVEYFDNKFKFAGCQIV